MAGRHLALDIRCILVVSELPATFDCRPACNLPVLLTSPRMLSGNVTIPDDSMRCKSYAGFIFLLLNRVKTKVKRASSRTGCRRIILESVTEGQSHRGYVNIVLNAICHLLIAGWATEPQVAWWRNIILNK